MLIAISSNSEPLFLRNVLDVLALPREYVHTFRYHRKYAGDAINTAIDRGLMEELLAEHGREVLIVYAQRPLKEIKSGFLSGEAVETNESNAYTYCPVRFGTVEAVRRVGELLFVDIALSDYFVDSDPQIASYKESWDAVLRMRPRALDPASKEGAFFDVVQVPMRRVESDSRHDDARWIQAVDRVAQLHSMRDCAFFRIRGVFVPLGFMSNSLQGLANLAMTFDYFKPRKAREIDGRPLAVVTRRGMSYYSVPIGVAAQLRLLFYRPSRVPRSSPRAVVSVEADKSGYSEIPAKTFSLESRYDELRVPLVAKRAFDNVLAPVSIRVTASDDELRAAGPIIASQPVLMTVVTVPSWLLTRLFIAAFCGSLLLAMSAADWGCLGMSARWLAKLFSLKTELCDASVHFGTMMKVLGAVILAWAGWAVSRRFPLK